MKFGIALPIRRDFELDFHTETAKKAEELGFDSVWVSDHVVVPDRYVGRFSKVFYDPFVLLSTIAAQTKKVKLGTSVIILPYRNPIVVAKMVATLDMLSEGRVIFGVGTGWMREEFDTLRVPHSERGRRTDEYIRIFKELWEKDEPRFEGEFFRFSNIKFYPKPFQKPHPPIWVGGGSKRAVKRAVQFGNGWHPTWVSPEDMEREITYITNLAKDSGRELKDFVYSVRNRLRIFDASDDVHEGTDVGERPPFSLCGTAKEIRNHIKRYEEIGVSHLVVDVVAESDKSLFDTMERFAQEIMPEFMDSK
ncbi:MAG TPA: LLM class F420-dependent oxidoreductase [Thermodesulfobacteriota bacterium]|nr:LLM class F420-dependent oxidoreductase [Thermodesulfobacteriota bacterium]